MAPSRDESNHRVLPDNGHCLLLMEPTPNQRTFRDYPNLMICLADIDQMYSEHCQLQGLAADNHNIEQLWIWMDGFHQIEVMVYDQEIARYKSLNREELKPTYVEVINNITSGEPINGKLEAMDGESSGDSIEWD